MVDRTPAMFVGEALGLDFLNSIATPIDTAIDWIEDGEGYLRWLEQAHLVPGDVLRNMRAGALPGELDKVAAEARKLREWFRDFVRRHQGSPLTTEALGELGPLNRLLQRDETVSQITPGSSARRSLEVQRFRQWRSPDALLLPVAEALAQLVCTEDFSNVKACEGRGCTLLFADHRRGGRARRWCSMAVCGNRMKQSVHRHRLKARRQ